MAPTLFEPGALRVLNGQPNPAGAHDAALYLFAGDASSHPISRILPDPGVLLPPTRLPLPRPLRIKLLHYNDLHGHVACFSAGGPLPVYSRMAWLLRSERRRFQGDDNTLVLAVSGGDEFGGAIFDELLGEEPDQFQLHAGYLLGSRAGVDVGVLGNHDFDRGAALLAHAITQEARFPLLAANLVCDLPLAGLVYAAALFVARGVRLGFIGLTTPAQIHPELRNEVQIADPLQTVDHLIPALRPHCDVLIVLSHLGYSLAGGGALVEAAGDIELARHLPPHGVHLILGGHTHHALNEKGLEAGNIVNEIPIVQAGKLGQYVGEVVITVHNSTPACASSVTHARLTSTANLPIDAVFEAEEVQPILDRARPYWERSLGQVAPDEELCTDNVRNDFAAGESPLANFIADALAAQCRQHGYPVDFAVVDASSVRCGLPLGNALTFGQWFDVMPFADTLGLVRLSASQLQALLDDNARRLDRPDEPHTERGFLHFSRELRYAIDPGPARTQARAMGATLDGEPLATLGERQFLVAVASFAREPATAWESGAGRGQPLELFDFHPANSRLPRQDTHLFVRDLLVDYIVAQGGVLPEGGARRDGRLVVLT